MPCLSSTVLSALKASISVSKAQSQLAVPLTITTFLGSSVVSWPKGSAVCTGAGVAAAAGGGEAGLGEALAAGEGAGDAAGDVEGLGEALAAGEGVATGAALAAGARRGRRQVEQPAEHLEVLPSREDLVDRGELPGQSEHLANRRRLLDDVAP